MEKKLPYFGIDFALETFLSDRPRQEREEGLYCPHDPDAMLATIRSALERGGTGAPGVEADARAGADPGRRAIAEAESQGPNRSEGQI